jgi:hypothetical protein
LVCVPRQERAPASIAGQRGVTELRDGKMTPVDLDEVSDTRRRTLGVGQGVSGRPRNEAKMTIRCGHGDPIRVDGPSRFRNASEVGLQRFPLSCLGLQTK